MAEAGRIFDKYKWNDDQKDKFINDFNEQFENERENVLGLIEENIDTGIKELVKIYHKASEGMKVKSKKDRSQRNKPWWDNLCKTLKAEKNKALRTFRMEGNNTTLQNYKNKRKIFKEVCKTKRIAHQKMNRQALIDSRTDNNKFWKNVKKFRYKPKQPNEIDSSTWVSHFKTLLYSEQAEHFSEHLHDFNDDGPYNEYFNAPFTMTELLLSIKNLKLGKSSGPDGIIAEMIKCTSEKISTILLILFNKIFELSWFPENWAESILCPIFKSGSLLDPNNFRGISLIDVFNKILTGMLYTRLSNWSNQYSKIDESQAGFRRGYSTVDNLFTLMSMGQKYLSKKGGRFYCLFVDFSKAFDNIDHVELMNCLIRKGVHGKYLKLLIKMYGNLCCCVKLGNGKCTDNFKCNIGTRQGCKLSPILFNLFINELIEGLNYLVFRVYKYQLMVPIF